MTTFAIEELDDLPPAATRAWRLQGAVALLLVALLAVAFRLPYLTQRSIWYDEASSWQTAKFSFPEMMKSLRLNVHMPLYYILLKGWMAVFGDSVVAIRGFSITFGALTVVAMGLFGRELHRASVASEGDPLDCKSSAADIFGLLVALLVALSACQVYASVEARMYTVGTFLAAMSSWFLLRAVRAPERVQLWLGYGLTLTALPYSHHYALFTAAAQYAFLGLYLVHLAALGERGQAIMLGRKALLVAAVAAVVYIPGFNMLRFQTGRVQQDYWVRPLSWEIFFASFGEFFSPRPGYQQQHQHGWIPFAVFALCCIVVARRGRYGDYFVLALAIVPMILSATASMITPVWVGRYFRFTQLFMLATIALAMWRLTHRSKVLRVGLFTVFGAGLVAGNVTMWQSLDLKHHRGPQAAVASIMAHRAPGEMIVALDAYQYFPTKFYVKHRATVRMIAPHAFDDFWGWHLVRPADLITPEELDAQLKRGVWIISNISKPTITPGLAALSPRAEELFTNYDYLHARVYVHHYRAEEKNRP